MTKTLSLRDANQSFARCIREVEAGEEIVVTRRGRPVARIVPADATEARRQARNQALDGLRKMMRRGWHLGGGPLDRDALHER